MARYAEGTSVAPERSRAEIEQTLRRYGANAFSYGFDGSRAAVAFRLSERMIRFEIYLPSEKTPEAIFTKAGQKRSPGQVRAAAAKMERQRWRALLLVVKAKLESVESGIETIEEAFMAQILLPDGSTVGSWMQPQIAASYESGNMPSMLPGARRELEQPA